MSTNPTAAKVLAIAASQIGYREGRSNGHANNDQKYSNELPGFAWSDFQAWCATFINWCFWRAGVWDLIAQRSASCDTLASGFKKAGLWSTTPAPGAIVFYGKPADLSHVGIVESFTSTTITTIEGNTNDNGSREGDGVYRKVRPRSSYIVGYGHPAYPPAAVAKPATPAKEPMSSDPDLVELDRDLQHAIAARKPGAVRKALREALAKVRAARRVRAAQKAAKR